MPLDGDITPDLAAISAPMRAAGIVFMAESGRVLFLKRIDDATWCGAGGKIEDGETPLECAVRETTEEMGVTPDEPREFARIILPDIDFTAFLARVPEEFAPVLNEEHTAWAWADPADPPQPVHANMDRLMRRLSADELGVARMMAFDGLSSPQRYANVTLFDLRITGTGAAYRPKDDEIAWRDPSLYCNEEFLARCNGLPVIWQHPKKTLLTSDEYGDRVIGSVFLPYIKGEEVWGIAKVYDDEAISVLSTVQFSTSPGVGGVGNTKIEGQDGKNILVERKPSLIDHLAICEQGVWDKGADPSGVRLDSVSTGASMADAAETKTDAAEDKPDPVMDALGKMSARMDAWEEERKADKAKADAAKCDADEDEKKADADEESEEKKDEADPEAKADSVDVAALVAAEMAKRLPRSLTDAEMNELSEAQARADSIATAFGERAPRPMQGEAPLSYRRRVLTKYQGHSQVWSGVDLSHLKADALTAAEAAIFADAQAKADSAAVVPMGELREFITTDETGRRIKTYRGSPDAWMNGFKMLPKFITGINRNARGA